MDKGIKEEEAICSCCKMASMLLKSDVMRAADEQFYKKHFSKYSRSGSSCGSNLTLVILFDFQSGYTFFINQCLLAKPKTQNTFCLYVLHLVLLDTIFSKSGKIPSGAAILLLTWDLTCNTLL